MKFQFSFIICVASFVAASIVAPQPALAFIVKSAPRAESSQVAAPSTAAAPTLKPSKKKFAAKAAIKAKAAKAAPEDTSWAQTAQAELEKAAATKPTLKPTKKAAPKAQANAQSVAQSAAQTAAQSSPPAMTPDSPATVKAQAQELGSAIVRTSLKLAVALEGHRPNGRGVLASGESMDFANAQNTALIDASLRWLPGEAAFGGRNYNYGGFVAAGYSRQSLPVVAPSGFRYDDVALNTLRFEGGAAASTLLGNTLSLEGRLGVGQMNLIQTSKYPEVTGSFSRPYSLLAFDAAYYLAPRFALMGSLAKRFALSDGTGSIAFDAISLSGGLIVQLR